MVDRFISLLQIIITILLISSVYINYKTMKLLDPCNIGELTTVEYYNKYKTQCNWGK
jgi:hypothetical protein